MMQTRRPDNQAWRPPNPGGLLHSDKLAIFTERRPKVLIFDHDSRVNVLTPQSVKTHHAGIYSGGGSWPGYPRILEKEIWVDFIKEFDINCLSYRKYIVYQ